MIPSASVIVRAKNEEAGVVAALRSLRAQTVPLEIIVVDSGSTDRTIELAAPWCDRLLHLPPDQFTFGRSLNVGAEAATGSVVFALSAHCAVQDRNWAAQSLVHYVDDDVAGTFGAARGPSGEELKEARAVLMEDLLTDPHWGFSNHASSWRRATWERLPFNETMGPCEDKEWMWRVMRTGQRVVADPALVVVSNHRRAAGARALWRREVAEHRAVARLLDFPVRTRRQVLAEWWDSFPEPSPRPLWQRRLSPMRNIELLGGYLGDLQGARLRDAQTIRMHTPDLP